MNAAVRVLTAALTLLATAGLHGQTATIDRLVEHLRKAPTDDELFDRAIRLIERQASVTAVAERLQASSQSAEDHDLVGRLWRAAGRPARALSAFEAALEADPGLARGYPALCDLYLRGRWPERARSLWETRPAEGITEAQRLEIEYRLEVALGDAERARVHLVDDSIPHATRVQWARTAGVPRHVAFLEMLAGDHRAAIAAYLDAGAWQEALEVHEKEAAALDDETAYRLARASGRADLLEAHFGTRTDAAATRYRERLSLSLGVQQRRTTPPRDEPEPTRVDTDRQEMALRIIEGSTEEDPVSALTATDGPPTLVAVTALLRAGREDAARAELTRWWLEPDPTERRDWLPRIERLRPDWGENAPLLVRLERTRTASKELLAELDRALTDVEPGSEREAVLQYHRGRMTNDVARLERAARIAPGALVRRRHEGAFLTQPIGRAISNESTPDWPGDIPRMSDDALGRWDGRVIRPRRGPLPDERVWSIERWDVDILDANSAPERVDWDANGVSFTRDVSWRAGRLAPLVAVIRLPATGWLVVGRGAALFERATLDDDSRGLVWQVEMNQTPTIEQLAVGLKGVASPGLRRFLDGLRAPRLPNWTIIGEFLDGVRRRHRDPGIRVESLLQVGDRVILRATSGERAVLKPGAPTTSLGPPLPPRLAGRESRYRATTWGWLRQVRPELSAPVLSEMPTRWQRIWQRRVPLPTRERPMLEATGPAAPPAHEFGDSTVVASAGVRPRVIVCSDGMVLYFDDPDAVPRWIGRITPPLPGPLGFPETPSPLPGHAPTDRGPHRAGPVADSRTPRIFLAGLDAYICTDEVIRFGPDGEPSRVRLARRVEEIRDLTVDRTGQVWVVPGAGNEVLSSARAIRIPEGGAFDVEAVDDSLFVLGHDGTRFWLREIGLKKARSTVRTLPDLPMDRDREGLRITSLGRWGSSLLLLHDRMYSARPTGGELDWKIQIEWSGHDPHRLPYYLQARPHLVGETLIVTRPWGVVEGWGKAERH